MLRDKCDVIEKFRYRLEMKLKRLDCDVERKEEDFELSYVSEMKYEESLKYSSYKKGKRDEDEDDKSEKSAPPVLSCTKNIEEMSVDRTFQDKLKHELFVDFERFNGSYVLEVMRNERMK